MNKSTHELAQQLVSQLQEKQWLIRCVESCTSGALTAAIGSISGASAVLDRSWVTYSNQAKHEEVDVPLNLLQTFGAVSKEVVLAMAEGAVRECEANTVAISISGIAGPTGGTPEKPVGTVWIAIKLPQHAAQAHLFQFHGSRAEIQEQAVNHALDLAVENTL